MVTTTYQVAGMSCGHCVHAVQSELGKLGGVTAVEVELATGAVAVSSEQALDVEVVRAAVDEAGYELVS